MEFVDIMTRLHRGPVPSEGQIDLLDLIGLVRGEMLADLVDQGILVHDRRVTRCEGTHLSRGEALNGFHGRIHPLLQAQTVVQEQISSTQRPEIRLGGYVVVCWGGACEEDHFNIRATQGLGDVRNVKRRCDNDSRRWIVIHIIPRDAPCERGEHHEQSNSERTNGLVHTSATASMY